MAYDKCESFGHSTSFVTVVIDETVPRHECSCSLSFLYQDFANKTPIRPFPPAIVEPGNASSSLQPNTS